MLFYRISLIIMVLIWVSSIYLWLMPEADRWEQGLHGYYTSTFLELPFIALILGIGLVYIRKRCTSPLLFRTTIFMTWGYVFFPVVTSALLIAVTVLGISGY